MQKLRFIHGKLYLFSTICTGKVSCIWGSFNLQYSAEVKAQ